MVQKTHKRVAMVQINIGAEENYLMALFLPAMQTVAITGNRLRAD